MKKNSNKVIENQNLHDALEDILKSFEKIAYEDLMLDRCIEEQKRNRKIEKAPRMVHGYEEVYRSDGTFEPYVYMSDGVYIHPDDVWW